MSVALSIADVREALLRANRGSAGEGETSTRLLGRLFHAIHADLLGADRARNGPSFLLGLERDRTVWNERLLDQCYRVSVGPRLARHTGYLHGTTQAVLAFWQAVKELVAFVTDVTWAATEANPTLTWEELASAFQVEAPLVCELEQPGWSDSVQLTGIADCMLRAPKRGAWCAVELKLGEGAPAVDLAQAALYHLIGSRLEHANAARESSALALIRFSPRREELLLEAPSLAAAQQGLLALIGKMAGVARETPAALAPGSRYADLGERVVTAYREYGRAVEIAGEPIVGPRFVRFEARLGKGVRYEQIKGLTPEVGLRLGLAKDPIVSRAGGQLTIDLVRPDPEVVAFESIADTLGKRDPAHGSSKLLVGVGIDGRPRYADLSEPINAHVLVAGTTGSGKTEWLRSAIASLLVANTPATLRLVLLDPKQTAFGDLKTSKYLFQPAAFWVPGAKVTALDLLGALVTEMERRYASFKDTGVDDLSRHVEKTGTPLPRIVLFCDEYYALIAAASKDERKQLEAAVGLLGAKARASGIHLVLAMQQASRKVIQGSIDTNIPCRVALMTGTAIESRMVLQADGADQLTGYGDLLYKDIGDPVRLQAPYLEREARARIFAGN